MLWDITWIIVALMIIVTAIYLPKIEDCDGWCCSSTTREGRALSDSVTLPYLPSESKQPLHKFSREAGANESGSRDGVMILENFYTGLTTLNIPHQPVFNVARLASDIRPEAAENSGIYTYVHKNRYPLVALSGKKGSADEIYMTAYMAQALSKTGSTLIVNGMTPDSPAFQAWSKLVVNGIIHWRSEDLYHHDTEHWASGTFKDIDPKKCVSEYLYDMMSEFVELGDSKTRYYIISKEREDELRKAYRQDRRFVVNNTTSAFHAATLKVIYPSLNVSVEALESEDEAEQAIYAKATAFLETYILV